MGDIKKKGVGQRMHLLTAYQNANKKTQKGVIGIPKIKKIKPTKR